MNWKSAIWNVHEICNIKYSKVSAIVDSCRTCNSKMTQTCENLHLGAVSVLARVGHREETLLGVLELEVLVSELLPGEVGGCIKWEQQNAERDGGSRASAIVRPYIFACAVRLHAVELSTRSKKSARWLAGSPA
jgi:hypothetical protein